MTPSGDVAYRNLASFVRVLRHEGFVVTTATTEQLATAGQLIGLHNYRDVREAFRSIAASTQAQSEKFDELFESFFTGDILMSLDGVMDTFKQRRTAVTNPRIGALAGGAEDPDAETEEVFEVVGASSAERLMDIDFADLSDDEAAAVASLLASMVWTVASFRSRRWRPSKRGTVRDLRRTFKAMTGPHGDLIPLAYSTRRPRQRPLIVLADISGSMERYSEMLLHFVHGAQSRFHRVEAFVFATRLTRVTRQLERRDPSQALRQVAIAVPDWSGGTRIGEALRTFNRLWSRRVVAGGPVVLIISDGWDTGDPALLAAEMRRLRRSVHRIIWLNPLAGHEGYAPEARGMAAALPYLDELVAGGTARNLEELIDLLQESQNARSESVAS
ncbi:MAG: vWA domain-containing protein [Acidimicrobiia bacterium]